MKAKRKKKNKYKPIHIILLLVALGILCVLISKSYKLHGYESNSDPHFGQVEVFNGDSYMWIVPEDEVERNPLDYGDFALDSEGRVTYIGSEFKALRGVDVSQYQGNIDWQAVYDSDVRFAVIRAGGRYYGSGEMYSDDMLKANLEGAKNAGLKVGVYFFSQAVTEEEAREEARFTAELLGDTELDLPIFFDWERVMDPDSRTYELSGEGMTDCAVAFCREAQRLGYSAGVYVYPDTAYNGYTMARLDDFTVWCSCVGRYPYFYYAHELWQYNLNAEVPGIDGECDINMMFIKK